MQHRTPYSSEPPLGKLCQHNCEPNLEGPQSNEHIYIYTLISIDNVQISTLSDEGNQYIIE